MIALSVLSIAFSSVWYILITAGLALLLYLFSYFRARRKENRENKSDEEEKQ